jgi:hypothetical protein
MLLGKDVVDAVAVVAGRSHDETVHEQGFPVDRVDKVRDGLVVMDGAAFENDFARVAFGAGLVKVEDVGPGTSIR